MNETRPEQDAYLAKVCDFINSQSYLEPVSTEALKGSRKTQDLGITSLSAIALVASYLTSRGLKDSDLNPEWVPALYQVDGIVSVFREIDALAK
ncbi:MAG TPA: hypothetical protein VI653_18120 [Steroidobacteraceae bacterium]